MLTKRSSRRPLLAATALLLTACTLSGCALFGRDDSRYPNYTAANTSDDRVRIPMLVPKDATDIWMRFETRKRGAWFRFDSATGITAPYCHAGQLGGDANGDSWWPKETPSTGQVCGDWRAFSADGHWYAWDTKKDE